MCNVTSKLQGVTNFQMKAIKQFLSVIGYLFDLFSASFNLLMCAFITKRVKPEKLHIVPETFISIWPRLFRGTSPVIQLFTCI